MHLLSKASVRVVLGDEVDCAVKVFDHLVKPDDVRVLELLEVFELLHAKVAGGEVQSAYRYTFELLLVKLFDRILLLGLYMLVQIHLCKTTLAYGPLILIFVQHFCWRML